MGNKERGSTDHLTCSVLSAIPTCRSCTNPRTVAVSTALLANERSIRGWTHSSSNNALQGKRLALLGKIPQGKSTDHVQIVKVARVGMQGKGRGVEGWNVTSVAKARVESLFHR